MCREIQRLRHRIKELEEENRTSLDKARAPAPAGYTTPLSSSIYESPVTLDDLPTGVRSHWEGLRNRDAQTGAIAYYGPLSACYYGNRVGRYMSETTSQEEPVNPVTIAPLSSPPPPLLDQTQQCLQPKDHTGNLGQLNEDVDDLSRSQEESFLVLLSTSFHCIYPVVLEKELQEHYESLWASPDLPRKPSALVDSVLAVCILYGTSFLGGDEEDADCPTHAPGGGSLPGYSFYRRAQRLLAHELERPSLMTLQAYIYCVIFLQNASLINTAHAFLGQAVTVAQTLGLHLQPSDDVPPHQQDLHARIWWTLYRIDCQMSVALGRPSLIPSAEVLCDRTSDDAEHVHRSGTSLQLSTEDGSWLSFHVQSTRLSSIVRQVQDAFHVRCVQVLQRAASSDIFETPEVTEELATFLGRKAHRVYEWAQDVPEHLKNRKGNREAFSVQRVVLNLDGCNPLWLQRQRILLELVYHHFQMSISRPFIRFPPHAASITPIADGIVINCLNHAIALTNILHQVLSDTDLLCGWSPVFQYQWDASLCILGFLLGNPLCPPTPSARKGMRTAMRTLEELGTQFPAVKKSAEAMKELAWHAERHVERFRGGLTKKGSQGVSPAPTNSGMGSGIPVDMAHGIATPELSAGELQAFLEYPSFNDVLDMTGSLPDGQYSLSDETYIGLDMDGLIPDSII